MSDHDIITEFAHWGPIRDHSREIARRIILSIAEGKDPPAEDVEALVSAVLDSPLVKAAQAVIEAEPRYIIARLIDLAAMVAKGHASIVIQSPGRTGRSSEGCF